MAGDVQFQRKCGSSGISFSGSKREKRGKKGQDVGQPPQSCSVGCNIPPNTRMQKENGWGKADPEKN